MTDETMIYFGVIGLAAFLIGLSKGGLGGILGALITPLVALVMPLEEAVGLLLPVLILGDMFALAAHWRRWDTRLIWLLLPGSLIGVTLGTFILTNVPALVLRRGLGVFVLVFVAYRLLQTRILKLLRYQSRPWHGWLAGGTAGFFSTLAHAGGPLIVIYLLMLDITPGVFVATSALFFAVLNLIKVPYYLYAGLFDFSLQVRLIWLAPLLPLGVWIGRRLTERVHKQVFEVIILVFLSITAWLLLTR